MENHLFCLHFHGVALYSCEASALTQPSWLLSLVISGRAHAKPWPKQPCLSYAPYYTHQKHTVGSWAALFQPCTQHAGPPFCLKNHLKSTFDQNKSSISIPPVQPPAGCCFPDEDALHCMGSTRCLAATACTREASEMEWRSMLHLHHMC